MMNFKNKSKLIKVRADSLAVHPLAQRELVPSKLKKIAETMDLDAIGVLHAVEYPINGKTHLWIIDGQHRQQALIHNGFGEWMVEVKVHTDANTHERACALFLKLNDRTPVSAYDKFINEVRAEYPAAVGVTRLAKKYGIKITRGANDGCATCVTTLKSIYNLDNGLTLERAIGAVISAWGTRAAALEGKVIEGVGIVFHRYAELDQPGLVKKMAKYRGGPSALIGDARSVADYSRMSIARAVATRIIDTYNGGRRIGKLDPL